MSTWGQLVVFSGTAAIVLVYALRGGGSYDTVVFQENALVIWWILGLGFALGLLPRARPSRGALVLLAALAAYAAWTAASLVWSESSELTSVELARVLGFLGIATLAACVLDRDSWRPAAWGLGFAAFVVCFVAVGSRLAPSVFGADRIDQLLHIDRLSRPFGYWNSVAAWGAMCTAAGLAFSAHDTARVRRVIALAAVPLAASTTYLTYSRAGVAGTALALLAVIALSRNRWTAVIHVLAAAVGTAFAVLAIRNQPQIANAVGTQGAATVALAILAGCGLAGLTALVTSAAGVDGWRLPRGLARSLAVVGGVVVIALAAAFGPTLASHGWHSFTRTQPVSSADATARLASLSGTRYPLWRSAVHAFEAHPLDGIGAGAFEFWWNRNATDTEFVRDTHNIWLQNLAELGLPGLLLIAAVAISALGVAFAVRARVRGPASTAVAVAVLAMFIVYLLHASLDWMWQSTATTVLALGGVGIVAARLSRGRADVRLPGRAVLAVLAALAAVVQVPGLLSETAVRRSQRAERAGNATLALAWARRAVTAEPWSASAYEQRALVFESAGRFVPAASDLDQAIAHEPTNYNHWLLLSRVETERGHIPQALRDYRQAYRLRPTAAAFANPAVAALLSKQGAGGKP